MLNVSVCLMPALTPNIPRIIASIHLAIKLGEAGVKRLTQYDIVKSLFLADRQHLNEWGRPVTYDNYVAMKHGPVPNVAYDLLKANEKTMRSFGIHELPWKNEPMGAGKLRFSLGGHNLDVEEFLSHSDVEAISQAVSMVQSLGFSQVRRLTHQDPAYLDAWIEDGDRKAYSMKLGLLFEEPNFEQAEILAEQSAYV